jgi:hypothetical protein
VTSEPPRKAVSNLRWWHPLRMSGNVSADELLLSRGRVYQMLEELL